MSTEIVRFLKKVLNGYLFSTLKSVVNYPALKGEACKDEKSLDPKILAIKIVKDEGLVTKKSLILLGIADRTASKALFDLTQQGVLIKTGNGRNTKYISNS